MLKRKKAGEWVQEEGTHFIVVDLDVFSRRRLSALADAFGDQVFVLHEGRWGSRYSAHFELHGWNQTADQQIRGLVSLIRKLPRLTRALWNGAQSRVFNIGVQAGLNPHSHEVILSSATITDAASVRAGLVITTYAPEADGLKNRKTRGTRGGRRR